MTILVFARAGRDGAQCAVWQQALRIQVVATCHHYGEATPLARTVARAVSRDHLLHNVAKFAYHYDTRKMNDGLRVEDLLEATKGKRLMYREPGTRTS